MTVARISPSRPPSPSSMLESGARFKTDEGGEQPAEPGLEAPRAPEKLNSSLLCRESLPIGRFRGLTRRFSRSELSRRGAALSRTQRLRRLGMRSYPLSSLYQFVNEPRTEQDGAPDGESARTPVPSIEERVPQQGHKQQAPCRERNAKNVLPLHHDAHFSQASRKASVGLMRSARRAGPRAASTPAASITSAVTASQGT